MSTVIQSTSQNELKDAFDYYPAWKFQRQRGTTFHERRNARKHFDKLLAALPYRERYEYYIRSQVWTDFRKRIARERKWTCEECHATKTKLNVHHLTYERLGHELDSDVKLLCIDCHRMKHVDVRRR
jgi:hypothetical protein